MSVRDFLKKDLEIKINSYCCYLALFYLETIGMQWFWFFRLSYPAIHVSIGNLGNSQNMDSVEYQ